MSAEKVQGGGKERRRVRPSRRWSSYVHYERLERLQKEWDNWTRTTGLTIMDPEGKAKMAPLDREERLEKDAADRFLRRKARAYFVEPPEDQKVTVRFEVEEMAEVTLPFTRPEYDAIVEVWTTYRELILEAGESSGSARELMKTGTFPSKPTELQDRKKAVWKYFVQARAAEHLLFKLAKDEFPSIADRVQPLFESIKDFPDKLMKHPAPPKETQVIFSSQT